MLRANARATGLAATPVQPVRPTRRRQHHEARLGEVTAPLWQEVISARLPVRIMIATAAGHQCSPRPAAGARSMAARPPPVATFHDDPGWPGAEIILPG